MRAHDHLLTHQMRRRLAMSRRGLEQPKISGAERAPGRGLDQPPKIPGTERAPSPGIGPTPKQRQITQHSAGWRSSGDHVNRTGRSGYIGAGQGAWLQQGPASQGPHAPTDRAQARPTPDPRQLGADPAPHAGFAQAQRLAQQTAAVNRPGGFTPRHDWEAIMNERQGGGVQTTGSGLGGGDVVDLGDTRMDQRAPGGGETPTVETARAGTGLQAGDSPPPAEEQPTEEDAFDPEAFEQQRQEASDWFSSVFGVSIEEYAEEQGIDPNMIYGLLSSPYISEIAFIDGTPQARLDYARIFYEMWKGTDAFSDVVGPNGTLEDVMALQRRDAFKWRNLIHTVNDRLGLPGSGLGGGPDRWNEFHTLPQSVWGLYQSDYRNSIDAYNAARGGGGEGEGGTGGPIEGGFNQAPELDPWEEYARQLAELEAPQFDQATVDDLIRAQQRDADLRNAQAMRAAMAAGGRTGVAPEASMGRMQQQMQQAGVNAANIRAQQQMQAEIQNFEAQIRHYQNQIDGFRLAAQHAGNAELQAQAAAQAQRLARIQGQIQQQLLERQWQLQNTFGLQTGLDLVGDLGGAVIGGALGGIF